jgi:hypothetical protein
MVLLDGFIRMQEEMDGGGEGEYVEGHTRRRGATWTDERDDAPLHHYPRATDPMATAEELITLGVSYRQE